MGEIPDAMMAKGRDPRNDFRDEEVLFRRFRPDDIDDGRVAAEAFELPDMSVNRQALGPAQWLLLDEDFAHWGVGAFLVKDIPHKRPMHHLGVIEYVLQPEHVPLRLNWPHSEVRVYRDEVRICRDKRNLELLDPYFHLRWRERLSRCSWIAVQPGIET